MIVDHVAIQVDSPREAVEWYVNKWDAKPLYVDDTWGLVQFENIKLAFVISQQHPAHFAFKVTELAAGKMHRDGTRSRYDRDPWGNIYELIEYTEQPKEPLE